MEMYVLAGSIGAIIGILVSRMFRSQFKEQIAATIIDGLMAGQRVVIAVGGNALIFENVDGKIMMSRATADMIDTSEVTNAPSVDSMRDS